MDIPKPIPLKRRIPEAQVESYFVKCVRVLLKGEAIKGDPRNRVGFPDRTAILPGGITWYVEIKTTGGKLTPNQIRWGEKLKALSHNYCVLWSKEDVDNWASDRLNEKFQ